jgi:hypothetical protein
MTGMKMPDKGKIHLLKTPRKQFSERRLLQSVEPIMQQAALLRKRAKNLLCTTERSKPGGRYSGY